MGWRFQNLVQGFLVAGGLAYVAWGLASGETIRTLVGVLAVAIGAVGLWRDLG